MIDREKYKYLLADTGLLVGKFDRIISLLDSGENIPPLTRSILSSMLRLGSTGSDLQLVVRRRDGKRGAPTMSIENLMTKVELGRRVVELRKVPGDYDAAAQEAAEEFGVSERTAKSAYSYVKKFWEERARKTEQRGLLPNRDASKFDLFTHTFP
jgi:hypothetical protein